MTVQHPRHLAFTGPVNFRDLGGYPGAGGRPVRWGLVYRSDALVLDDSDLDGFAALGISTVYDLRSTPERELSPNRFGPGPAPAEEWVPLISEDGGFDYAQISDSENFLASLYQHVLERSAPSFGRILTGLADAERLPAVFHCAAGKDRTGLVAAVLLLALGVDVEQILDDYELTASFRTTERVQEATQRLATQGVVAPEVAAGLLTTPRAAMATALEGVVGGAGGIDAYLTGPAGADPGVPGRLRDLLLGGPGLRP